ncbi:type II restriction endonuclease [Crocosphaera sp. UHCC 0190]|uniref:type II restriction endonuclease n=1 Tax=Crocosphaera sp. UHCC 0190 TaxID=3110246 RepID=UPI002B2216F0|nr:type II restriction endonuclease [Crocosphaera sp. UHCC 0190]MEA5510452.1 type II restriction endonuclease [Crocosphaera sp. UHCC 0190]
MKYNSIFSEIIKCGSSEQVFDYLVNNLKESILKWDYFVNWEKVNCNFRDIEISLNLLNYLIGKENVEQEAKYLFKKHHDLVYIVPSLIAYRDKSVKILTEYKFEQFQYQEFYFDKKEKITDEVIEKVVFFLKETGFLQQISSQKIKSLTDYFLGVEVGLDTNGRKNRSGTAMEEIIEYFINSLCQRHNFQYISQANTDKIKKKFNKHLTVKNSSKKIDFVINTPHRLFLIETNFYRGGGSKLKATAGEYSDIFTQWQNDGHQFIWVTDGVGWLTAKKPLQDAFNKIDYILNLSMVQVGVLEALILDGY